MLNAVERALGAGDQRERRPGSTPQRRLTGCTGSARREPDRRSRAGPSSRRRCRSPSRRASMPEAMHEPPRRARRSTSAPVVADFDRFEIVPSKRAGDGRGDQLEPRDRVADDRRRAGIASSSCWASGSRSRRCTPPVCALIWVDRDPAGDRDCSQEAVWVCASVHFVAWQAIEAVPQERLETGSKCAVRPLARLGSAAAAPMSSLFRGGKSGRLWSTRSHRAGCGERVDCRAVRPAELVNNARAAGGVERQRGRGGERLPSRKSTRRAPSRAARAATPPSV